MVYLDYASNSKVDKEVLDIFYDTTLKYFQNPNSNHKLGLAAKKLLEEKTENIAKNLNVSKEEIIYTSGATESNNLAIKGTLERYKSFGKHVLISSLEHTSIMASATKMADIGFEIEIIKANNEGVITTDEIKKHLREDTILVSVTSVDSELGIRQPIEEIGLLLKEYPSCHFHTDSSQLIGKDKFDFSNVDLITIAPHKFSGMNGFGVLIKKKDVNLIPMINGGRSTTIYRSGTPDLANVVALDKALEKSLKNEDKNTEYVSKLNKKILESLKKYNKVVINSTEKSIPYIINFSVKGLKQERLSKLLENEEIYISTKTSCCPVNTPSKLVYAKTKDKSLSASSIRLSMSDLTTEEEINTFLEKFDKIYKELEKDGEI